jgi:hypothetical protein
MPLDIKITPISQSFQVLVDETLSPKARSAKVADFARRQIRAADEINRRALGAVPPKKVTVNGREDELLTNVPPDQGIIIAEYRMADEVLEWIMKTLRDRSPIISGEYKKGHRLFADDVEVNADNPPIASRYTFFNLVPYARRLEVGKTNSGRDFLIQVPNRIYARTYQDAKAKFGNVAKITTGFESTANSYKLKNDQASRSFTRGFRRVSARQRSDRVAGSVVSVPAIYVTIG